MLYVINRDLRNRSPAQTLNTSELRVRTQGSVYANAFIVHTEQADIIDVDGADDCIAVPSVSV